ncbi:arginine/serine-rich coiled-coil protein 2-like isoform X2 [Saccostrea cucullata]|uniref:arginine/serine-rich coiled-coil protein 2-like isoform X2 n=1 Tax=Saccostrea cuccullata TaxID=36930 RepID=UPI002ED464F7
MDLLANYDDDGEKSQSSSSNKQDRVDASSSLQAEWESFEKMISGLNEDTEKPTSVNDFLQAGIVAYPGSFKNNTENEKEGNGSSSSGEEEGPKKSRSFAEDVMKLFRSEFVEEELDMPPRARSSSHSSGSSHSSRSASASPSPDRQEEKEEDEQEEEPEKDTSKEVKEDRRPSTEGQSSRKRSRSRSRSRTRRTSHSRKKSRSSRSRSRSKRRSRDRKGSSSRRRHRRSRSRDRKHRRRSSRDRHRHKKDRRRSRSRDRHRKRSHRSRSRHRSRSPPHKHRSGKSRSRSRDRGHHPAPSSSKPEGEKHLTFKEKMRQQLLKASKYLQAGEGGLEVDGTPKEKPSNLPLSDGHKRFFEALASSTQSSVTPQMALLHTMAAMHQKAQEMTGVAVPKYYNPAAVNPLKYAEQVQKRKLLWSKAKEHKEDKEKEWQHTAFNQDENGKMATKFKKLMGLKEGADEGIGSATVETEEQKKKREELFSRLDKDYEFARMTTHTQRGVGLGFSSQGIQPP